MISLGNLHFQFYSKLIVLRNPDLRRKALRNVLKNFNFVHLVCGKYTVELTF